jgi:hypothetical protein
MQPHPFVHARIFPVQVLQSSLHPDNQAIFAWGSCVLNLEVFHPVVVLAAPGNLEGAIAYLNPLRLVIWEEMGHFMCYNWVKHLDSVASQHVQPNAIGGFEEQVSNPTYSRKVSYTSITEQI